MTAHCTQLVHSLPSSHSGPGSLDMSQAYSCSELPLLLSYTPWESSHFQFLLKPLSPNQHMSPLSLPLRKVITLAHLRGLSFVPIVKVVADNETPNRTSYRGSHAFKGLTAMVPSLWFLTPLLRSLKTQRVRLKCSSHLGSLAEMLSDPTILSLVWKISERLLL